MGCSLLHVLNLPPPFYVLFSCFSLVVGIISDIFGHFFSSDSIDDVGIAIIVWEVGVSENSEAYRK